MEVTTVGGKDASVNPLYSCIHLFMTTVCSRSSMDVCHLSRAAGRTSSTHWSDKSSSYQHFFGTTTVMERLDRNLTSVLATRVASVAKGSIRRGGPGDSRANDIRIDISAYVS